METEYKIEVCMTPHPWDNPNNPYWWCILKWGKEEWCNDGFGWSKTPEQAWIDANEYYNKYKKSE